jgi:NAD(P)-dependent dehydrogenase (short-subunit alcohol dehydrogenase family)
VVIVNHAIYETAPAPLVDMELDQWKKTLDVNLTSSFLVTREYLRGLKGASESEREKAAVVFIGSTAGKYGKR